MAAYPWVCVGLPQWNQVASICFRILNLNGIPVIGGTCEFIEELIVTAQVVYCLTLATTVCVYDLGMSLFTANLGMGL